MENYDDIRPYNDKEFQEAMRRIANSEFFGLLCTYVYPGKRMAEVREMMLGFKTVKEFQHNVMYEVNRQIVARSIENYECNGLDNVGKDSCALFVSNHRDIMLDACLLQYSLVLSGRESTQITFGANLMSSQLLIDIGKCNKMFKVERGGKLKDFYMSSRHLSEYIRHVITENNEGVWIAQRNGRTKDGRDQTDQGIIKMFTLSMPQDKIKAIAQLNVTPVSVSYEWEPCDILKALELYETQLAGKYVKKPGEDQNSILTGIVHKKGRVVFNVTPRITEEELLPFNNLTNNEYHKQVAAIIDERIQKAYTLFPNNYIAHDLRYGQQTYADKYSQEQFDAFCKRMEKLNDFDIADPDRLKDIYLGIYANPVESKKRNENQ